VRRTSSCPGATATRCQTAVAARAWLPNASAWHARAGRALPRRARNARYRLVESHVSASTSHPVFPAGGCMTCVGRSRQGCSASACASKPRGGAESSKWKPSWRSRDLSKARLGRGETRRTRRTFSPRRKAGCLQERCCHSAERAQARYSGKYGPDREAVLPGQAGSAISALPAPVRGRGLSYRAIRL
jgi:hypothetical protein